MSALVRLDKAVRAVCPISGASVAGDESLKENYTIHILDEATASQRAAAQVVLDAFDPNAPEPIQPKTIDNGKLAALLIEQGTITQAKVDAFLAAPAAPAKA